MPVFIRLLLVLVVLFRVFFTHADFQHHIFKCPSNTERRFRAEWYCLQNGGLLTENYACLFNEIQNISTETCNFKPHTLDKGEQFILRHRPVGVKCKEENRYQPFRITKFSSECIYHRSTCSAQGLIRFNDGNSEVDKSCRCNFEKGYVFVSRPRRSCYCIPSKEDCSCYIKNCPTDYVVSPDYQCTHKSNKSYVADCPDMNPQDRPYPDKTKQPRPFDVDNKKGQFYEDKSTRLFVFVVTAICTFLIAVGGFLIYFSVEERDLLPPEDLKAVEGTDGIKLTWNPPLYPSFANISKYQIEIKVNGQTEIVNLSADQNSYLIQDVIPSQLYSFVIKTCCTKLNKNRESKSSNAAECRAADLLPPEDLKATEGTDGIKLTWNPPLYPSFAKISKYQIEIKVNGQTEIVNLSADQNSHLIPDVIPSHVYSFVIKTCCAKLKMNCESDFSKAAECRVADLLPPEDLKATEGTDGIKLTWNIPLYPSFAKISKYQMKIKVNGQTEFVNLSADQNSHLIPDVIPSQLYSFVIKTCCTNLKKDCESEFSNAAECRAADPLPPQNLKATAGTDGIHLNWNPPLYPLFGKISQYQIENRVNGHTEIIQVTAAQTYHSMPDVFPSQVYCFAIKTCCTTLNENCESEFSDVIECRAKGPLPPKILEAVPDSDGILIKWSVPEYPTMNTIKKYIVELETGKNEIIKLNVASDQVKKRVSNVFPLTKYSIRMATYTRSGSDNQTDGNQSSGNETKSVYSDALECTTGNQLSLSRSPMYIEDFEKLICEDGSITLSKHSQHKKQDDSNVAATALNDASDLKALDSHINMDGDTKVDKKYTKYIQHLKGSFDRQEIPTVKIRNDNLKETRTYQQPQNTILETSDGINDCKDQIMESVAGKDNLSLKEPYKCGCHEMHKLEIKAWKRYEDSCSSKVLPCDLQKELQESPCVALVGTNSKEVNTILHHIALEFVNKNMDFVLIPCKTLKDIYNHYQSVTNQIFVLEIACGSIDDLVTYDITFNEMLQAHNTKIIISFTADLFLKWNLSDTHYFFSKYIRDLSPEYSVQLAPQHPAGNVESEHTWRKQLDYWFVNDKPKHCALFATTLQNGCLSRSFFKETESQQKTDIIQKMCDKYSLDCDQVETGLLDLPTNFVTKDDDKYKISNSIFRFLCYYFITHKELQDMFMQLIDGKFFYEKVMLECIKTDLEDDMIVVKKSQEESYFRRIIRDVSGKDYSVFYSIHMQTIQFRQKMIFHLTEMGSIKINELVNTKELQEIAITGRFQRSPLLIACSRGYEELVAFMLRCVKEEIKNKIVSALFRISVDQGYPLSIVKLLESSGVSSNSVSDDSWTALSAACLRGSEEIAIFLINKDYDIHKADASGTTPVMLACYTGLYKTVCLLIDKNVDINKQNNMKMSALKYACIKGDEKIVSVLLDKKADSNTIYEDGRTPLVIAYEENNQAVITVLRNNGFDIETADTSGKTALAMACISGDSGTVKSLIGLGADVNSRDNAGWAPLSRACKRGAVEIVKILASNEMTDLYMADTDGWTPLKKASLNGHIEVVNVLLKTNPVGIDKADKDGWTPLMSSCQKGHANVVESLICNKADVNHRSNDGKTPLIIATQNGQIEVIDLLLKYKAQIDLDDDNGWSPIRVACNVKNEKAVSLLLQKGGSVDKSDKKGYTPLKIACNNGNENISSLLISAGADVNKQDNDGWTPFKTACKEGNSKICKMLLSQNADINISDFHGWTPLKTASVNGHIDVVELLLMNKAEVDKSDTDGVTALMSACQSGHEKIARRLVENGAWVNHQSHKKLTPLIVACQRDKKDIIKFLITNKANVNLDDVDGRTPLIFTCMRGYIKATKILIQHEADVNKADKKGWTPLKMASKNKNAKLVGILINAKADVNFEDNDGWTPLKTASREGDADTVELLLNYDVDINKEDKEGWTPLKSASVNGHYQIVRKLLQKKADVDKTDHEGWTSLMAACKAGNIEVIRVLLEYKADVNYSCKSTGDTPFIIACTYCDAEIVDMMLKKDANWKWQNNLAQTGLLVACMFGKATNVSKILQLKVDIDVKDRNGLSPLKAACQGLWLDIVESLLKAGANIDIIDNYGYTPLLSACETQNIQLVELLVQYKANVNQSTPDGWSPYLISIKNRNNEISDILVKYGADLSAVSLSKACEIGYIPVIQLLLDQSFNVICEGNNDMSPSPLQMVIAKRKFDVLDIFIKKGVKFDIDSCLLRELIEDTDEDGFSALTKACANGNTETITYLLKEGADISKLDNNGHCPLINTCLKGIRKNVDLLLQKYIEITSQNVPTTCSVYLNTYDKSGYTPLTAAASQGHDTIIELLITNGADPDKLDKHDRSPIMYACEKGDLTTVKALCFKGASMTAISDQTSSPILFAKQSEAWDVVNYLIENGGKIEQRALLSANITTTGSDILAVACKNGLKALVEFLMDDTQIYIDSLDVEGLTPLMHACKMNQPEIVKIIVTRVNIDFATCDGKTALMIACIEGYTDIVEILLQHSASIDICDTSGHTSLMIACGKGPLSIIKILLEYGADMNLKTQDELSALSFACYSENYEIVDYLLSERSCETFEYDIRSCLLNVTSIKELKVNICKSGLKSIFKILIKDEDEIDATDEDGNSFLMLASQGGHDEIIEYLLKMGANINFQNKMGWNALRMACNGGLERSVNILLKKGVQVNQSDNEGRTPLMIASQGGYLDVIKRLVENSAKINLIDRKGTSALKLASELGHIKVAEYLLSKGGDAGKCDIKGMNSLMGACQNGHIQVVRLIAKTKIDLNSCDNNGCTPIRFACDGGHNGVVEFLIQNKAEIDKGDTNCSTPLKSSCRNGNVSTVALLIENSADVNKQDKEGWTPLMSACQNGYTDIAELLLNNKADIDMTEMDGWTALRIACNDGQVSTVKFLVLKGANVNKVDKHGWSVLKVACTGGSNDKLDALIKLGKKIGVPEPELGPPKRNYEEIVSFLIKNDANVNLVDKDGWTCLMSACKHGHTDLVSLVLSKIDDINKADNKGATAFIITCSRGYTSIAKLLLNHGADINKVNSDGWTPLKIACQDGHVDTVRMLLSQGAEVNIEDKDGWTALMSACKNGNRDIVQSLLESGAVVEYRAHDGSTTSISIAKSLRHRQIEKLLRKSLEGSIGGGYDDDDEEDEDDNVSCRRTLGRNQMPYGTPFFNDSDDDEDNDKLNLPPDLLASMLDDNDFLDDSPGCPVS